MYKQSISQTQNQIRLDCVLIFADQNLVWEIDRAGKCPESIKMQRNKSYTPPTPPFPQFIPFQVITAKMNSVLEV